MELKQGKGKIITEDTKVINEDITKNDTIVRQCIEFNDSGDQIC